jgi:hypothetical protein
MPYGPVYNMTQGLTLHRITFKFVLTLFAMQINARIDLDSILVFLCFLWSQKLRKN